MGHAILPHNRGILDSCRVGCTVEGQVQGGVRKNHGDFSQNSSISRLGEIILYVQQVGGGPQIIANGLRLFPKSQEVKRKGSRAKICSKARQGTEGRENERCDTMGGVTTRNAPDLRHGSHPEVWVTKTAENLNYQISYQHCVARHIILLSVYSEWQPDSGISSKTCRHAEGRIWRWVL
ncbi:hypothetical protein B0H17DRAFT_1134076 [Mycena rosella]|uniref:Uncharacterized protein n=1 Tax=Mycena rosella TaxID=1033263 RepID=A0AAD7GIL1_MYCRO|nr:hypothetical protein B0H17DRAFT_1134076 [Mycena rosella]